MVIIIIEEVVKEVNLARRSLWRLQKLLALNPARSVSALSNSWPSETLCFLPLFEWVSLQKLGQEGTLLAACEWELFRNRWLLFP